MIIYKKIITAFMVNLMFLFPISILANEIENCNFPLTSVAAELDNNIIFLPSQENIQKQFVAFESNTPPTTPEFQNGRIGMTLHFNAQEKITNLPISFCMDIGSTCELLPVWDSKKQLYTNYIDIEKIVDNGPTNAYIELVVPPSLVEKVRPYVSTPVEMTIRGSLACSTNLERLGIELVKIPIVDLNSINTKRKGRKDDGTTEKDDGTTETSTTHKFGLEVKKTFIDKTWGGDKASANVKMTGALGLYRENSEDTDNKWQSYFGANIGGAVSIKIFSNDIEFLKAEIIPKKPFGQPFATNLKMTSFGATWMNKNLTESNKKARSDKDEGKFTLSLSYSVVKEISKSSRFTVGIVPLKVAITAKGELGIKGDIIPNINTDKLTVKIKNAGPYIELGGSASAGVDAIIFGGGVRANLTFVTEQVGVDITTVLQDKNVKLSGSFWNNVEGLKGNIELYATWKEPKWGWPPYKNKEATQTIFGWENQYKRKDIIIKWGNRVVTPSGT